MDAQLVCSDCGCVGARVETIQIFTDAADYHDWDIHLLCACPNPLCKHFGRYSLKRLVAEATATLEEEETCESTSTVPSVIEEYRLD